MALAPYVAVLLGLYVLHSAWSALALYHAQIVLYAMTVPRDEPDLLWGWDGKWFGMMAIPSVLAGVVIWLLMGQLFPPGVELGIWLSEYGLTGFSLYAFAFYFGVLHPSMEQFHWDVLRQRLGLPSHVLFAGYHVLVLALVLKWLWVAVAFVVLLGASLAWHWARNRLQGLSIPVASHTLGDLSVMVAVVLASRTSF